MRFRVIPLLCLTMLTSFINGKSPKETTMAPHTVIVVLEAKPGKETALKNELLKVMAESRKEKTCIEYRVHQDVNNPTQFVLYENWTSVEDHAKQFKKSYILEFAGKLEDLLAKPYLAVAAKMLT